MVDKKTLWEIDLIKINYFDDTLDDNDKKRKEEMKVVFHLDMKIIFLDQIFISEVKEEIGEGKENFRILKKRFVVMNNVDVCRFLIF